ncbi:MAG TPA: hypothetical protein VFH95_07535 [Candidatus Kapabacteria bacterium]|nr:hypothetical protein [Candidatus Kapabacteria bacterium]
MHTIQPTLFEQQIHPDRTALMDAILLIIQHEQPLKARQIAYRLSRKYGTTISRYEVNRILFSKSGLLRDVIVSRTDFKAYLRTATQTKSQQRPIAKPIRAKTDRVLIGIPTQPLVQPNPQATDGVIRDKLIRRGIGLGYAFLAFEVIRLLL